MWCGNRRGHVGGFACARCHRVLWGMGDVAERWNWVIAHLTAGLLYGHEVKRPAWFVVKRKAKFAPRLGRTPSKRRPQILEMALRGLMVKEIAAELGLSKNTVDWYLVAIYREHD